MPFGSKSLPSRIYRYALIGEPAPLAYVRDQLGLCRGYRNNLIEIELAHRAQVQIRMAAMIPGYAASEAELAKALGDLAMIEKGVSKPISPISVSALKICRLSIKALTARLKIMRAEFWELSENASLNEARSAAMKSAYTASAAQGLYWASINATAQSMNKALRSGPPPRFSRWDGSGRLVHQVQGEPLTWERALLGLDTRLRVSALRPRGSKRWNCTVSVRLGSVDRKSIWVECPILLHRPLPDGCKITNVYLTCKRKGSKSPRGLDHCEPIYRYFLCFVVARTEGFAVAPSESGVVALDVGWRLVEDGLRVCYFVGDKSSSVPEELQRNIKLSADGMVGELIIPWTCKNNRGHGAGSLAYWKHTRDLQSIRDSHYNDMMASLREYVSGLSEQPKWMGETAKHLHLMKSKDRILNWLAGWKRHDGDEAIYAIMSAWRRRETHLRRIETDSRENVWGWRKDLYVKFWAWLRSNYTLAVVENLDLAKMRLRPDAASTDKTGALVEYRNLASCGLLLSSAAMPVKRLPPEDTTAICHACRNKCVWDHGQELTHQCEHCGEVWDQDENACRNLLYKAVDGKEATAIVAS